MFSNARNVVFTGNSTFTSHVIDDRQSTPPRRDASDEGIKLLVQHVAKGAMHDSGERFDAPTCHPKTRIDVLDDILRWADDLHSTELVTWMYGPAGGGKSAIAQTICEKLHERGQLAASFFFSRSGLNRGTSDESRLIATLAYQITRSIPAARRHIAEAVWSNPIVWDFSLYAQMRELIVEPLKEVYNEGTGPQRLGVIVIDGLDACRKDDNAQSHVIGALIRGTQSTPHRRHKILITSRPEHNIATIFKGHKQGLIRKLELDTHWNPDADIQIFLTSGLAEIRQTHPYFECLPPDVAWPSCADISALVERSSGQFIYASAVLKYIRSDDYFDPVSRLDVVLQLQNNGDKPYVELDSLYEHIFSQVVGVEKVLTVLSLERMHSQCKFKIPLGQMLSDFIGARIEEIKFWLRPLVSLLLWEDGSIRYMHASLPDFLLDQSRSGGFCIRSEPIRACIMRRASDLREHGDALATRDLTPILLEIPRQYSKDVPSKIIRNTLFD